jgi:hypothetical protein
MQVGGHMNLETIPEVEVRREVPVVQEKGEGREIATAVMKPFPGRVRIKSRIPFLFTFFL